LLKNAIQHRFLLGKLDCSPSFQLGNFPA